MLPQLTKLPCLAFSEFARLPPDIVNVRHGEVHRRRPIEAFLIKTKVYFRVVEEPFVKVRSASNKAQLRLWARTLSSEECRGRDWLNLERALRNIQ